jgi:large subunit ribosomal protein L4
MAKCVVRDWQGKESGQAELNLAVAKETTAPDLLHRAVVRQLAHARQGTASTLTRAEVAGGGRKPYKQKGTGRARQGSIRTPLRPGGGIVFGPKPRTYSLSLNRKERRLALRTALMSRLADITVVKAFGDTLQAPKTKEITAALQRLDIAPATQVLLTGADSQRLLHGLATAATSFPTALTHFGRLPHALSSFVLSSTPL